MLTGVVVLVLLVVVALAWGDEVRFVRLLRDVRAPWLGVGVLLQLATYVSVALVLRAVLRRGGRRTSLGSLVALALARLFTDQAVPTGLGGLVLIEHGLERRGAVRTQATAGVLLLLVTMLFAQIALAGVGLALTGRQHAVGTGLLWGGGILAAAAAAIPLLVVRLRRRGVPPRLARVRGAAAVLRAVTEADDAVLRDRALVALSVGCELAIVALDAATLWACCNAVGQPVQPATALAAWGLGAVAATLGPIPGGLGTFDATATAVLAGVELPVVSALAAVLLARGLTQWLPLLPGAWAARRELAGPWATREAPPAG